MDLPQPTGVPTIFGPGQAPRAVKPGAAPEAPVGRGAATRAAAQKAEPQSSGSGPGPAPAASQDAASPEVTPEGGQETGKAANEAQQEAAGSGWNPTLEELLPEEGMPAIGSVVRVSGLKALPELNGALVEVIRPASQRVVVQTRAGEKAVRPENLDGSLGAVVPSWAAPLAAGLLLCTGVAPLVGRPLGVALVPLLALSWAMGTLAVCGSIYRCCWHTWCLPSFSSVCGRRPNRTLLRLGFIAAGLLLFASNWLYGELVLPQILDGPIQIEEEPPPAPPPVAHEKEVEEESVPEFDAESQCNDTEECGQAENVTENATENVTAAVKRPRVPSAAMIQGSLLYGYIAACTFSLVGLCFCDRWWSTLIHVTLGMIFTFAGWQHTWTSSSLLTSARGQRYAEVMGELYSIAKFRQMISDFAPLVAMGVPITAQVLCQSRINVRRNAMSTMGFLETSGMLLSMKALQWGLMLTYLVFVGSYSVDFWILSSLPPEEELI